MHAINVGDEWDTCHSAGHDRVCSWQSPTVNEALCPRNSGSTNRVCNM